jgi:hypothetical protein
MKLSNLHAKAIFSANLLIVVSILPLASMPAAIADNSSVPDSFTFPEGRVVQRTIHNVQEFESLRTSSSTYQIIRNGNLLTFGSRLELLSSENLTNAGVWTIANDGNPIGITNCTNLAFGLDECKSITNLVSGIPIFTVAQDEHIDPHELLVDAEGNFWYLSYPKTACEDSNEVCQKFKIPKGKVFADCQVNQVSASGGKMFSWNASDHIPPEMIISSYIPEGPRLKYMDLFHCNSIDLIDSDNFLISVRNNNAIYQVNKKTSSITWKLGGRYWPNVSLRGVSFDRHVGKETIAQHDARYLGNGFYSYFDNASHTDKPARGVVFRVTQMGNKRTAKMHTEFVNPHGNNSLCTGSFTKVSQETYVIGWGCSLNGITIFNSKGNPIVSLNFIKTEETKNLFSDQPWILNGEDWGPRTNRAFSYRVIIRR